MTSVDHIPAGTDDFPVTWEAPGDPDLGWERDDMHMPFALAPLAEDYVRTLAAGFNHPYEVFGGFPQRMHGRVWNGYAYFAHTSNLPEPDRAANRERWLAVMRERIEATERYWMDEVLPELRTIDAGLRAIPVETMDGRALTDAWDAAWASVRRMWDLHFAIILGPYMVMEDLADLYEAALPDGASGDAMRLVQGSRHELLELELGVERLAAIAAAHPAIAALLGEAGAAAAGESRIQPGDLAELEGGPEFLAELDAFLAQHGHMGQGFDDLLLPSWTDDPGQFLLELSLRLRVPPESAVARRERLAAEAERLAGAARERLSGDPERLAEFERLLGHARAIGPLTEVHNYWIDRLAQARLRTFALRIGARLVTDGSLGAPDDVLYLHRAEVREAIEAPGDRRSLVAARREEHERRRTLTPPRNVGAEPGPPDPDRFDGHRFTSTEDDVILGTGASAGIVRGPARV
ncbi:MAG: hypothetical protein ABIV26_07070, partial [Candidatus Limnocylindrales bacterium]